MIRRIVLIIFISTLYFLLSMPLYSFSFTGIGLEDGLSHSRIYALLQDSRGFMWIGTSNGLNRYDGRSFRQYKNDPDNPRSLPHNYVTSLIEDREGYIWVGTDGGGAARFDPRTGMFDIYNSSSLHDERRLSDDYIWGLLEDSQNRIWFGTTYGGVSILDKKTDSFLTIPAGPEGLGLSGSNVWPMIEDRNGDIWIGTDGGGLTRYAISTGRFIHYRHREDDDTSLSSDFIFSLYIDRENTLWIGTSGGGLDRFNRSDESFVSYRFNSSDKTSLSNNTVRAVYEDTKGRFWVGTTDGLNIMDRDKGTFSRIYHIPGDERSLSHSRIHCIIEDRGGLLWFGTRDGISLFQDPVFESIPLEGSGAELPGKNDIRSILPDGSGGIYIGTYHGLYHLSGDVQREILKGEIIYSLHRAENGILYCGTDKGLIKLSLKESGKWERELIFPAVVNQVLEDPEGFLWVACAYEGLALYDPRNKEVRWFTPEDPTETRLYSANVPSLMILDDGKLLLAGGDYPLLIMDRDSLTLSSPSDVLFQDIRSSFLKRSGALYYFALEQKGLLIIDSEKGVRKVLGEKDGLPSHIIRALIPEEDGSLWISSLKGIARYEPDEGRIYSFGLEDGLPGLIFNPSAAESDSDSHLYFGSTEGLAILNREDIILNETVPPLAVEVFRELSMTENLFRNGERIVLDSDNRILIVKLSAFDYSRPSGIRYAYRFSDRGEWIEIGNHGEVVFSHLAPGDYVLQVRSSNSNGLWIDNRKVIPLLIRPPVSLRWYMIALYVFLLVLAIFLIVAYRSRIHLRTIRQQEELVFERTRELEEAKRALEQEINRKSTYFINLAHETKTPLTFIQNYIRRYIEKKGEDRDLRIVRENVDKLVRDMVNYLDAEKINQDRTLYNHEQLCPVSAILADREDLIREAAVTRGLSFNLTVEKGLLIKGDPLAVDRIINNLIDNALKYNSEKGAIDILLKSEENTIVLEVRDQGKGLSKNRLDRIFDPFYQSSHRKEPVQGIGMGLYIVRKILDNMGAHIEIESEPGEGSTFRIVFVKAPSPEKNPVLEIGVPEAQPFRSPVSTIPDDVFLSGEHKTIIIVDDDKNMLTLLRESLSEHYNLIFSESAEDILERIPFLTCPDLIISDVMLEGMDGHELLQRIQEGPWKSAPFIFLSARGGRNDALRGIDEGAVDYIAKPFHTGELIERIEARLKGQSRRRDIFLKNIQDSLASSFNPLLPDYDRNISRVIREKELSPREEEILRLMVRGKSNKEIASELEISVRTVEKHIYNLFRKTGVQSRIELLNLIH